jgi:YVTN family beta-propeller protein
MRQLRAGLLAAAALVAACTDRDVTAPFEAPSAGPRLAVSPTPERTFAYVANTGSNDVSVIRTSDDVVVATVAVGDSPRAVAITPGGGRAYVVNRSSSDVSVIRTSDNTVMATIAVGSEPEDVAMAPDGSRVYVVNSGDGSVSVIRTSDNTVDGTIELGDAASTIAITPDGSELFVNNSVDVDAGPLGTVSSARTSVVRTSDYTVRDDLPWSFARGAEDVAITPDGSRAYLPSFGGVPSSGTLRVVRTSDLADVASLSLTTFLNSVGPVAITPDGSYAYVVKRAGLGGFGGTCSPGGVFIVPTATNTLETTVTVSCFPKEVAFTPDGARAYVTNTAQDESGNVTVIGTTQKAVLGTVTVGTSPNGLAIAFVPTVTQLLTALQYQVSELDVASGLKGSLMTKLKSASSAIENGKTRGACGALQDFVSQVAAQSGKKLTAADASLLIDMATQTRDLLGC